LNKNKANANYRSFLFFGIINAVMKYYPFISRTND